MFAVSRLVACMALLAFHGPSFAAPDLPRTAAPAATAVVTSVLMPRGERAVVDRKPGGFLGKSTINGGFNGKIIYTWAIVQLNTRYIWVNFITTHCSPEPWT